MKKKNFGWYVGAIMAGLCLLSIATCLAAVVVKATLIFLLWLF